LLRFTTNIGFAPNAFNSPLAMADNAQTVAILANDVRLMFPIRNASRQINLRARRSPRFPLMRTAIVDDHLHTFANGSGFQVSNW